MANWARDTRPAGQPHLWFKDLWKWDMKLVRYSAPTPWKACQIDCDKPWRAMSENEVWRGHRELGMSCLLTSMGQKEGKGNGLHQSTILLHLKSLVQRDCQSRVGLVRHSRKCSWNWTLPVLHHHFLRCMNIYIYIYASKICLWTIEFISSFMLAVEVPHASLSCLLLNTKVSSLYHIYATIWHPLKPMLVWKNKILNKDYRWEDIMCNMGLMSMCK